MRDALRVVAAGDSALVLELEELIDEAVNARAVSVAHAVRESMIPGVRDVVPTFRSVAVHFDPLETDIEGVRACLVREASRPAIPVDDTEPIRIPVCYDGEFAPDLDDVARFAGLDRSEVVARHSGQAYRVFMLGFLPGFAYMAPVDPRIAAPRLPDPRRRVPWGSIGIAGLQTGIYPVESPGGWRLVGRTPVKPYDPDRSKPFLLQAGDRVHFDPIDANEFERLARASLPVPQSVQPAAGRLAGHRSVRVVRPGLYTTVQDLGRWGQQSFGVPVSGAMDSRSHRLANALVGNGPNAASLEITLTGPELEFEDARLVAVAGAHFDVSIDTELVPPDTSFSVAPGSRLTFGARHAGARAYLAIAGGIAVPEVLGSRATHVASRMGGFAGRALVAGDRVLLGEPGPPPAVRTLEGVPQASRGGAKVRVLPGPQLDRFDADALEVLQSEPYAITTDSNRMGYRLKGPVLRHARDAETISDSTMLGALQVPATGQPALLMADRQTTGGYPKLATVITADIPIAAQLAPGDTIAFVLCTPAEALAALVASERSLAAIEIRA